MLDVDQKDRRSILYTVTVTPVLLPARYFAFRETLSLVNLAGLAVCAAGL